MVSVDNTACNTITLKQTPDRSERPKSDVSSIGNPTLSAIARGVHPASQTKRKRKKDGDDIEGIYMQRIADEELRDARQRATEDLNKRRKISSMSELSDKGTDTGDDGPEASAGEATRGEANGHSYTELPQHESLTSSREKTELEKAVRTVFLGNVPTLCIKSKAARKALLGHLTSFCPSIPATDTPHKIESLRFRSTPFASGVGPKKAAYAKKELMDATTKCTNAYVVYSTSLAAREAVKRLNGTVVLDRHLLVDSVAHPRKTDHRRCVFVGNLGFVDDESQINAAKAEHEDRNPKKSRAPADVEEGLWRQFSKGGQVESVRVVRDASTRVGKGFAYVQYQVDAVDVL